MFGCCRQATASASARKRATSSGPAWLPARTIFSATRRFSATCRALYTTPMPPRPSTPRISYPGTWIESSAGKCAGSVTVGGNGVLARGPVGGTRVVASGEAGIPRVGSSGLDGVIQAPLPGRHSVLAIKQYLLSPVRAKGGERVVKERVENEE